MKKFLILTVLFSLFCGTAFADFGGGNEIGFNDELFYKPYTAAFFNATYRSDESPWCFSVNLLPSNHSLVAVADNWFVNEKLNDELDFYFFWGISGGIGFNEFSTGTGARIGAGLDWFVINHKQLELYWQICWNPYFGVEKDGDWGFMFRPFSFPAASGARWWFR